MVPKLVIDRDTHVWLRVRFAIEMLSHRRFFEATDMTAIFSHSSYTVFDRLNAGAFIFL